MNHRTQLLIDSHGRILRDLRVSVTDRCNFRCLYCLPETEAAANFYRDRWATVVNSTPIARQWKLKSKILTFEEIERFVRLAVDLGIQKVRLTGGEPLLRQDLEFLVERLAAMPGIEDLATTSNGFLFPKKGKALRDAGLRRVTFSCDSLDRANFEKMTGRDGLHEVLESIRLAQDLGLNPVKVNAVVIKGINDHEIESLAEFAERESLSLRFIEFMPLDSGRAWLKEIVVPGREILRRLQTRFDLCPVQSKNLSETAKRWTFADGRAEIGIIAPVSEPFCGHCNRIRLTADGQIRTCLFSLTEHDLRSRLRSDTSDEAIQEYLKTVVLQKETYDRNVYAEMHTSGPKRNFDWRLETPERAYAAGFRRLGIGALYGLSDWRKEALCVAAHADFLLRTCWKAQLTISLPRLRPSAGEFEPLTHMSDREVVQLICAFRLMFPDVGLVLSTREPAKLRDGLIPLGITLISAGSHTEPGGYTGAGKENIHHTERGRIVDLAVNASEWAPIDHRATNATGQFDIADDRTPQAVAVLIRRLGYEPVWKDWDAALMAGTSNPQVNDKHT